MTPRTKLSLRVKLFLSMVGLVLVVVSVAGVALQRQLRGQLEERLSDELFYAARGAADALKRTAPDTSLDDFADGLGAALEARVTLIDDEGRVLGDSSLDFKVLKSTENHGARPEVVAARREGRGEASRPSATVGERLVYVVYLSEREGRPFFVRVARDAGTLEASIQTLNRSVGFAGLIALILALASAYLVANALSGRLRALAEQTQDLAQAGRRQILDVGSGDEVAGIAGTFNEVLAALELAVGELAQERDRFQTVLDAMGEAVMALDPEARVVALNGAAERILGLRRDAQGRPLVDLVRLPELNKLAAQALDGVEGHLEFSLGQGGSRTHLLAYASPLPAANGAILVLRDVSEVRRLETVRSDFVANVSHELRTPVAIIQASAETLTSASEELPEAIGRFVEKIQRNAERMGRLVSDLLDLSRVEAEGLRLEAGVVELEDFWQRLSRTLGPVAELRDVRLTMSPPGGLQVVAQSSALEQVLTNLVENAVKYGPAGGQVQVAAIAQKQVIRFEIRDEGPGIAAEHRTRVFERFYRVDAGRSRDMGGTGLGLSICRHLVEAMGGEVGVEANVPQGALFWFTLPRPNLGPDLGDST